MPYSKTSELPEEVKKKYKGSKLRQFMNVVNSMLEDGKSESQAFAGAHSTVNKKEFYYDDMYEIWARQISQENAGYNPLGGSDTKACANCNWYVLKRDACAIVAGEISPTGLSDFWEEKQVFKMEPMEVIVVNKDDGEAAKATNKSIWDVVKSVFKINKSDAIAPQLSGITFLTKEGEPTRFVMWATNNFKDNHEEIITEAAHKEFIEWCDTNNTYPEFWLWHAAGSKAGDIDWLDYADGFLIASGLVLPEFESRIKSLEGQDIRCSHGFLGRWKSNRCVQYRSWEFSALPGWAAANPWTSYVAIKEEAEMAFSPKKREWLMQTAGVSEDQIKDWESSTAQMAEQLKTLGIEFKDTGEEEVPADSKSDEILQQFILQQKELTTSVQALTGEVAKLKATDDEKLASFFESEVSKLKEGFRPTESLETKTKEDDKPNDDDPEKEAKFAWIKEMADPFGVTRK